jgi:hypothetical protein
MSITVISEGAVKEKGVEVYLKKQWQKASQI